MKNHMILVCWAFLLLASATSAQKKAVRNALLPEKLLSNYPVWLAEKEIPEGFDDKGYTVYYKDLVHKIEDKANASIIDIIVDKALAGKIPVYNPREYDAYYPYSILDFNWENQVEVQDSSFGFSKVRLENLATGEISSKKMGGNFSRNEIKSLNFIESWSLDEQTMTLTKEVEAIIPVKHYKMPNDDGVQEIIRWPMFHVMPNVGLTEKEIKKAKKKSDKQMLYLARATYEYHIGNNFFRRTNPCKKCMDDYEVETVGAPFWTSYTRKKLVDLLLDKVLDNKVQAYNFETNVPMSADEVNMVFGVKKQVGLMMNPETGEMEEISSGGDIDRSEIQSIVFVEDWYVDPTTLRMKKEVVNIAPVRHYKALNEQMEFEFHKEIVFKINMAQARK